MMPIIASSTVDFVCHIRQHSLAVDEEYVSDIGIADGKLAKGENGTRTKNGRENK